MANRPRPSKVGGALWFRAEDGKLPFVSCLAPAGGKLTAAISLAGGLTAVQKGELGTIFSLKRGLGTIMLV